MTDVAVTSIESLVIVEVFLKKGYEDKKTKANNVTKLMLTHSFVSFNKHNKDYFIIQSKGQEKTAEAAAKAQKICLILSGIKSKTSCVVYRTLMITALSLC